MLTATALKRIQPVVTEEHHFEKRFETFFNNFLEVLDYQVFYARTDISDFQINLCFMGVGFPIETLLVQKEPEVKEESVIEFRKNSKKNTN